MKQKWKQFMSVLLSLAMVLGLMPGMSLTAYADGAKAYATYDVTTEANRNKSGEDLEALQVTFNDRKWYIILQVPRAGRSRCLRRTRHLAQRHLIQ